MAKRGSPKHVKRLAVPKVVNINDKKAHVFALRTYPGPHSKEMAMPLGILLRDILKITSTLKETKALLNKGFVKIDNKIIKEPHYPVGLMDVVEIGDKSYLITVDNKGRLLPKETEKEDKKFGRVVNKYTIKKGKIMIMTHDGRNFEANNKIKVGDTVIYSLKENKILNHIPFEEGAKCLIYKGKHAGKIAKLEKIIPREGKDNEAELSIGDEHFITVAKYLFVINDGYKGE